MSEFHPPNPQKGTWPSTDKYVRERASHRPIDRAVDELRLCMHK